MHDKIAWMILSQTPGIGQAGFWQCLDHFGSPAEVLCRSEKELAEIPGLRRTHVQGLLTSASLRGNCVRQFEMMKAMGGDCLTFEESDYPTILKEIKDPPPVLYTLGDVGLLNSCAIGLVGSRAATSYGRRTAFSLAKNLAEHGVTIVSGLALGIDTQAHKGALAAAGKTIAVLGSGVDVVYPRQNHTLFQQLQKEGLIISEYALGTPPEGFRFPARNRIIAGLSRGVIVVEAARKSGSLITAQLALDENREVYSVPGQVDSYKSEGTHWLLQQGAKLVQSAADILEDLHPYLNGKDPSVSAAPHISAAQSLGRRADELLQCIETYSLPRNEIINRANMNISEISELLLMLEIEGFIEILPGDEIRRLTRL